MNLDFLDESPHDATAVDMLSLEDTSRVPCTFALPNVAQPTRFLSDTFARDDAPQSLDWSHGTTTLAFKFQGGVIVAVDSRSTMGSYIGSQSVKKVIEINPQLLGTMAGGAADCSFWERELGRQCRLYQLRNKELISVAAASKILSNIVYGYKGRGLSMGTFVCGWDKTGPHIYNVNSDGSRVEGELFSVGSGSTFAYAVLDNGFRFDMTDEEAQELGRRAIHGATHRDAYSGGEIQVYHVKEGGWELISRQDTNDLYYNKYVPAKGYAY